MRALIGYFLLSGVITFMCWFLIVAVVAEFCNNYKLEQNIYKISIMGAIVATIIITFVGVKTEITSSARWNEEYNASKITIENSIDNRKLSGFERAEMVNSATALNAELAGRQYDCKQWYGFDVDKKVLDLKPITFE